jgi:hypothetical protein
MLEELWNEYWQQTLSSSPLLNNSLFVNKSVMDISTKLQRELDNQNKGGRIGKDRDKKGESNCSKFN